jgi:hypothetical protein
MTVIIYNPETPLDAARWLRSQEISVIPLISKSKFPREKYPLKDRLYNTMLTDEEIVAEFGGKNKGDINIGAAAGRLSKLLTFDVDGSEGKKRFNYVVESVINASLREKIKHTYVVQTGSGKGFQVHFRFDPAEFPEGDPVLSKTLNNKQLWVPTQNKNQQQQRPAKSDAADGEQENEIRLRGEGGYVIFPCSVTDNEYRFISGERFVRLTKNEFLELRNALQAVDLDEFRFKVSDGASDVITPENRRLKPMRLADMYVMDYATGELVRKKDSAGGAIEPNPEGGASTLPEALEPATKSLTEEQIMDIVSILKPHYEESQRHYICLYLSGWMRKRGVKYEHARATVEALAKAGNDNELSDRIRAVSDQYDKNTDGTDKQQERAEYEGGQIIRYSTDIKGYNGLKEILEAQFKGDTGKAWRLLHEIDVRLPKRRVEKAESDKEREKRKRAERIPNAKEVIIRNCKEIFVDQHGVPHIAIWKDKGLDNPKDHYEVMNVKEDRDDVKGWINAVYHQDAKTKVIRRALELGFSEEEARKMARTVGSLTKKEREDLYDWLRYEAKNSGVRHNLQIRIAGVDSTKDPNSAITSDLDDSLIDTIYYDLTNDDWEAIKITAKGWKIVKGDELPILFKRGANRAQIYPTPSGEYPTDILDQYVALLNIRNPKHQNLFKKWFTSLYWPATIAKPAPMPYGSWGGGKTTIFETVKDAIDPSSVLTTAFPKQAMELIQLLDQEYLVFFDNMPEIPLQDWFYILYMLMMMMTTMLQT